MNGIRGYEGRKLRCVKEGRRLHRTSKESQGARERKKLLAKLNWYRSRDKIDHYANGRKGNRRNREGTGPKGAKSPVFKSVLFVEQTPDGELARRLREVLQRLTPVMGFSVRWWRGMVEHSRASSSSQAYGMEHTVVGNNV